MPSGTSAPFAVDPSFYVDTQLADEEIVEREAVRQAQAARDAIGERERLRRMFAFHWRGGML